MMRPVTLFDLDYVVRVALKEPLAKRAAFLREVVHQADVADRYRKRMEKTHPVYGCGSLSDVVAGRERATAHRCDAPYQACLSQLLQALVAP